MCGIVGFVGSGADSDQNSNVLSSMLRALEHRGPDSSGIWSDENAQLHLGHTRLAIQDLTSAGHQPMISSSGNLILSFNGEIYNHLRMREELHSQGFNGWVGTSDTETLLEAIERWGLEQALSKANGMFAFALYNIADSVLFLVRDRFGEKPLYFGFQDDTFLFASDLSSLKEHPSFKHKIDRRGLSEYFRFGYVPSPYSIYSGIHKLEAGHLATLTLRHNGLRNPPVIKQYWDYRGLVRNSNKTKAPMGDSLTDLHSTLQEVVSEYLISDVSIGTFLSGGIDSSLITALAQSQRARPIQTFTIGSPDRDLDESSSGREVAKALGTEHMEFMVTEQEALGVVPLVGNIYSEPFADSSQIPSIIVAKLARSKVTVALTGDGGDEIFGGYNRYTDGLAAWKLSQKLPPAFRIGLSKLLESRDSNTITRFLEGVGLTGSALGIANVESKVPKLVQILKTRQLSDYYRVLTENGPSSVLLNPPGFTHSTDGAFLDSNESLDSVRRLMVTDALGYLSDDILVKVDRASMASSLETRAPFLDARVVNHALQLPTSDLIQGRVGKLPLRKILREYLPEELIDRPKLGFGIPLGKWLRGPLREWAEDLIATPEIERIGLLDPNRVQEVWRKHLQHEGSTDQLIWTILVFQLWLRANPKAH